MNKKGVRIRTLDELWDAIESGQKIIDRDGDARAFSVESRIFILASELKKGLFVKPPGREKICATCRHLVDECWKDGYPVQNVCFRPLEADERWSCRPVDGKCRYLMVGLSFGCNLWEAPE